MKRKIILSLLIIVVISSIIFVYLFADIDGFSKSKTNNSFNEKISSAADGYIEVASDEVNITNDTNLAKNILNKYSLMNKTTNFDNLTVKQYNNAMDKRKEIVVSNDSFSVTFNANTSELISYTNKKASFVKNTLPKDKVEQVATEIVERLNIPEKEQYEAIHIDLFDDEIWTAEFAKKEGELINIGNRLRFSFSPEEKEILTFGRINVPYANNKVLISKEKADGIAKDYLSRCNATEVVSSNIEIVRPNYFYDADYSTTLYTNINQMRKAYVYTFNDEFKSKVYIDCTTGEVIGGEQYKTLTLKSE